MERIGGDKVQVEVMVPPGFNPAIYEPKPSQIEGLADADIYVQIRVPFEEAWLTRIFAVNEDVLLVDQSQGIDRIEGKDPHIWLSPRLAKVQARTIYDGLARLDGSNEGFYRANLGAFLAPLVVSVLKGFSWQHVFTASALYCALMILPTLFFYREPPRPESTKKLKEVLAGAAEVLGDARFMLMIVVYSGFWILYFQNFGSVLWYLRDVIDKAPVSEAITGLLHGIGLDWTFTFDIEHVTVINAGTIILLQVLVSRLVANRSALPTMVTGMALGAVGFLLLAVSRNPWVFVLGIAVFSIGEMTAHPKYYSFIGLVAPQDRKAVYMGYGFLYGVFGSLLGSNIGAFLYARIIEPVLNTPAVNARSTLFWLLFALLDIFAALGLVLFFRKFGEDTPDTRRRAGRAMGIVYALIGLLGLAFLVYGVSAQPVQYRTIVQAVIFLALGIGGMGVNRRGMARAAGATDNGGQ